MLYPNHLTIREALNEYFKNSGFDERSYTDPWVGLPAFGKTVYLPNLAFRQKAVPFHDIDHVLTEYKTDWPGEWQISAYELGTGCGKYLAAWILNSQAILIGAFRMPIQCIRAFARGRRSRGIYGFSSYENLLTQNLGSLREQTTVSQENVRVTFPDAFLFSWVVLISGIVHTSPFWLAFLLYRFLA